MNLETGPLGYDFSTWFKCLQVIDLLGRSLLCGNGLESRPGIYNLLTILVTVADERLPRLVLRLQLRDPKQRQVCTGAHSIALRRASSSSCGESSS